MNNVTVNAEDIPMPIWSEAAKKFALKVLDKIKCSNWELSILFCGDKTMTALNTQYRNKAESTDILSFNLSETVKDIAISLDTLRENSKYFNVSIDEELRRLIIHGILHLNGMDHKTLEKKEPMLLLQEEILNLLKDQQIISGGIT